MPDEWVVDGYNFLHALGRPKSSRQNENALSHWMRFADFAATTGSRVLVVLDGHGSADEFGPLCSGPAFRIVYSEESTADAFIERYLCERRGTLRATVVTQDRQIRDIARGFGAAVMRPLEFIESIRAAMNEKEDILGGKRADGLRFNRPFEEKLKGRFF